MIVQPDVHQSSQVVCPSPFDGQIWAAINNIWQLDRKDSFHIQTGYVSKLEIPKSTNLMDLAGGPGDAPIALWHFYVFLFTFELLKQKKDIQVH